MKRAILLLLTLSACEVGANIRQTVAPPPPRPAAPAAETVGPPVDGRFVTLGSAAQLLSVAECHSGIVTPVQGTATAGGEPLSPGDVLVTQGSPVVAVQGAGVVVFATARLSACDVP